MNHDFMACPVLARRLSFAGEAREVQNVEHLVLLSLGQDWKSSNDGRHQLFAGGRVLCRRVGKFQVDLGEMHRLGLAVFEVLGDGALLLRIEVGNRRSSA